MNRSTTEVFQYHLYNEGEYVNYDPDFKQPASGNWTLRLGTHKGLAAREILPSEEYRSFAQCQAALMRKIEHCRKFDTFIWWADAISPDGWRHKLIDGAPIE